MDFYTIEINPVLFKCPLCIRYQYVFSENNKVGQIIKGCLNWNVDAEDNISIFEYQIICQVYSLGNINTNNEPGINC